MDAQANGGGWNGDSVWSGCKGIPRRDVFRVPVHAVTMAQVVQLCDRAIRLRDPLVVGVVNAAKLVNMRRNALLRESVLQSDLILADGAAVVWASWLLRRPLPERVTGIDLFEHLLKLAHLRGYSIYLLGASPQVLQRVVTSIRQKYPRARIAGAQDGYYAEEESDSIATQIRTSGADMLFLGMASPRKEVFLGTYGHLLQVPVCHGVGGSFDVLAGKVRRAPLPWQRMGMEWLYRVLQEPRRLWKRYLVTNSVFLAMLGRELMRMRPEAADMSQAEAARLAALGVDVPLDRVRRPLTPSRPEMRSLTP